jgi:hypothetical protein
MAVTVPDDPRLANDTERRVWRALTEQLGEGDLVIASQRVTDHLKDHEIDFVVAIEGAGINTEEASRIARAALTDRWLRECSGVLGERNYLGLIVRENPDLDPDHPCIVDLRAQYPLLKKDTL